MNYTISIYENNNWVALTGKVRPFSYTEAEDETLDSGVLQLVGSTRAETIKPLTYCKIEFGTGRYDCVIGNSKRVKRTFSGTTLYDWQLDLVEVTKVLERLVCDSMTFTNYLGRDYGAGNFPKYFGDVTYSNTVWTYQGAIYEVVPNYRNFYSAGSEITIYGTQNKFNTDQAMPGAIMGKVYWWSGNKQFYQRVEVRDSNNTLVYSQKAYADAAGNMNMPDGTFTASSDNEIYTITYSGYIEGRWLGGSNTSGYTVSMQVSTVKGIVPKNEWTVKTVCERILSAGQTRRVKSFGLQRDIDKQLIYLDETFATAYQNVKAPEFFLTRCTFYDALSQVGSAIHGIPRLYIDDTNGIKLYLTFDKLGGSETYTFPQTAQLNYEEVGYNVEDYSAEIDSTVENIVNTTDPLKGSMVEPCTGGYTTIRTERGNLEISADTMKIQTSLPIYRINKLEVSAVHNNSLVQGDITPYVFENAEYQALTEYADAAFPFSKAYALVYTQGQKDISGLNFKATAMTGISSAFQNFAIKNIINEALGVSLSDSASSTDYIQLAFRVTYTAIPTARVTQKKAYTGWAQNNTLIYNQDGNTVEAFNYGEKMKGAIARLGNQYVVRTYTFNADTIDTNKPKLGQLVTIDGQKMYITLINATYDINKVKMTIWFTPNFNRLSEYVGINSNYRLYDVSEKQSIDRLCNYSEICYVGDAVTTGDKNAPFLWYPCAIPAMTLKQSKNANLPTGGSYPATQNDYGAHPTTMLVAIDGTDDIIARPLTKLAVGNSIAMTFSMDDNYGVGYQSIKPNTDTGKRIQRLTSYGDAYGEFEKMHLYMYESPYANTQWAVGDQQGTGDGNSYPIIDDTRTMTLMVGTSAHTNNSQKFLIKKDSREKINFTYQLHYMANRNDVVVGSAMTQNSSLVGTEFSNSKQAVLYLLTKPLNILQDIVDLTNAVQGTWAIVNPSEFKVQVRAQNTTGQSYSAWALVDPTTNRLYVGKNETIAPNAYGYITFTFTSNNYGG